ncbi:MAG: hypothetical protein KC535_01340 [Nanoarchaeota archaeon]|nr:hypothetical protein [Nanoarchaeota archaeon]
MQYHVGIKFKDDISERKNISELEEKAQQWQATKSGKIQLNYLDEEHLAAYDWASTFENKMQSLYFLNHCIKQSYITGVFIEKEE